jgi:hypothetical protein
MMMVVLLMMCSDGVVTRCLSVVTGIRYTYCHDLLFAFIIALTHMALIIVFFLERQSTRDHFLPMVVKNPFVTNGLFRETTHLWPGLATNKHESRRSLDGSGANVTVGSGKKTPATKGWLNPPEI